MFENDQVKQIIRDYLGSMLHMSLGTCVDNKPWVCEVHFAFDDELNLYFLSKQSTRHCQEIAANPNVAGSIATTHVAGEKPRGIYFEGIAKIVENIDESNPAFRTYTTRLGRGEQILADMQVENASRLYKIAVDNWYLFDARESVPAQKYRLDR